MIRINLAHGRRAPARARSGDPPGLRAAAPAVAVFLVALVWTGERVRSLREDAARVAHETASAENELRRLAPRAQRFAALEARRTQLAARAAVVDAWRRDRRGAGRLLEHIGRSLPAGVRLVQLRQDSDGLLLGGQAVSVAAVSELAANLERLEQVPPPVEIIDTRDEDVGTESLVRFEIRARLASPAS